MPVHDRADCGLIRLLEFPYCYYAYVIDPEGRLDHLHFGLWNDDTRGMKEAQENLTNLVLNQIPRDVESILDVGCGLGSTSHRLSTAGYRVTGISPDKALVEFAKRRYPNTEALELISISFEAFTADNQFDLLLLQESAQYIDVNTLFSKARRLLRRKGYLLMCDEVRYEGCLLPFGHYRSEIIDVARREGFRLLNGANLTKSIMKSRDFGRESLVNRRDEICQAFRGYRQNVADELNAMEEGWIAHDEQYRSGKSGYEWFLFQKEFRLKDYFR